MCGSWQSARTLSTSFLALLAIMMDDGKHRRFGSQAIPLRTWNHVRQLLEANNDILSDPERARILLSEGGMILRPRLALCRIE
jgi:hypothetical protein